MAERILLIDDEPDVAEVARFRLTKAGYEVVFATDGERGLALARSQKPALILLDFRMPGLSGLEVCQRLKACAALSDIPVVFLTATVDLLTPSRVKESGAVDVVLKPFVADELLATVRRCIQDTASATVAET